MPETTIPAVVLGASGYVGGELLRLLASHPHITLAAAVSRNRRNRTVESVFPNLRGVWPELRFTAPDELPAVLDELPALGEQPGLDEQPALEELPAAARDRCAIFSTAPHGASAELVAWALEMCEQRGCSARVVDVSADFRFRDAEAYEAVYGLAHGAPERMAQFRSLLPEHASSRKPRHVGHPGCFATGMLLASVPLARAGLVDRRMMVSAVTGSTGAGRAPKATTHHPTRHANLFAYNPLAHRHAPEVEGIVRAVTGRGVQLHFVPSSGPFARGIYMVLHARLIDGAGPRRVREAYADHYADAPFVHLLDRPPRLKDVVGGNHALLAVAANRGALAVTVALDNLVKGAAGGAIQWMNLLHGLPETAGLTSPAPAWI